MIEALAAQIEEIARPLAQEMAIELVAVEVRRYKTELTIQVLADKLHGGISIDECSELNRRIGQEMETRDLVGGHYLLEVSSPGLDRPLKTARDFERNIGRRCRFFLAQPVEDRLEHEGRIVRVSGNDVTVGTGDQNIIISILQINKAKLIIDL